MLWRMWHKEGGCLEGVHAKLWDEHLLRQAPVLQRYWYLRDRGLLDEMQRYLHTNSGVEEDVRSKVSNACFYESAAGAHSHLSYRFADLYCGTEGGCSVALDLLDDTTAAAARLNDAGMQLHVMGLDSGTWPMDGGGVASCRRDVVERLHGVAWDMVAETGNDMKKVHRAYSVEGNVTSLSQVPLWGAHASPSQTVRASTPLLELKLCAWRESSNSHVIKRYFVPLVRGLVAGCATEAFTPALVQRHTQLFVNLHTFFENFDWVTAWEHSSTIEAWCKEWAHRHNAQRRKGLLCAAEHPTLLDMKTTLALFVHFLLPLSVNLRRHQHNPVTHATHHGIQALLGVVAKRKNGTSLVIWDHGVLWRERLRSLSNFGGFPLFARNALIGLNRLAVQINYSNADLIVPCCRTNMGWEGWMGSLRTPGGEVEAAFKERIAPVLNGMETDRFRVLRHNEQEVPTAVMLSHVYELKGVKDAIKAAAVIVHEYGVRAPKPRILITLNC